MHYLVCLFNSVTNVRGTGPLLLIVILNLAHKVLRVGDHAARKYSLGICHNIAHEERSHNVMSVTLSRERCMNVTNQDRTKRVKACTAQILIQANQKCSLQVNIGFSDWSVRNVYSNVKFKIHVKYVKKRHVTRT